MRRTCVALQGVDGAGHRQIGLAGAGRADAEVDVVGQDAVRRYSAWFGPRGRTRPRRVLITVSGTRSSSLGELRLDARLLQEQVHPGRSQRLLFGGSGTDPPATCLPASIAGVSPNRVKRLPRLFDLDPETALDLAQVLVELAAEVGQALVVLGLEDEIERVGVFGHGRGGRSAHLVGGHPAAAMDGLEAAGNSPRSELGSASVMRTSTNWPIRSAGPSKLTTRLFSVRPASCGGIPARGAIDQHALHRADHVPADALGVAVDRLLQPRQALSA